MSKLLSLALPLFATTTMVGAQTVSLDDVIARAIAHSSELRVLEAAVAEVRANAALGDAFRSSASVAATPGYATGLPTAVLGQVPAIGTVEAHRLLYDASARADQIEAASEVDAAVARLERRRREVAQSAAELYARLVADAALVASAQRRVSAYETIFARTNALRGEGRARDLDVDRAALHVSAAKRSALQAQTRLDLDQLRLRRLAGETLNAAATVAPDTTSSLPKESFASAETNDPELRSLASRIEALQRAVILSGRFFHPSVAAQIQYSRLFDRFRRYYLNFKPSDLSVGATVTLPVWTGGHRAAASARLAARLQQVTAEREARRTEIELAVREAEADVMLAVAENELAVREHSVAEESLRVAEELAREGRGEVNDVSLAQIALAAADDGVANARAQLTIARARLFIVRGDLPHM